MARKIPGLLFCALLGASPPDAFATDDREGTLARKTQNPGSDLASLPFQSNFGFHSGTSRLLEKKTVWTLNVQPVIPINLTNDWNLITRTIVPIINRPVLAPVRISRSRQVLDPGIEHAFGMGDINPTFFLSPADTGILIWGVGPTMTLPTASTEGLGSGKWIAGPAAVGLLMAGPWVVGALANNQWSFAWWGDNDVNQLVVQLAPYTFLLHRPSACRLLISPTSVSFNRHGGTGTKSVTTAPECGWTAVSNVAWITIVAGASGAGSGAVDYRVASNPSWEPRTRTIVIADGTLEVGQRGRRGGRATARRAVRHSP